MHRPLTANTSIDVENVTKGYIHTDEGRIKITQECTFMVYHKNLRFGIEVSHVDEDHDTYSIKVFNQSAEKDRYRREDIFDNPNNSLLNILDEPYEDKHIYCVEQCMQH